MKYRAFFSYSRDDDRIAKWLHRALDGYRTPKAFVGTAGALGEVPRKLHPIFRDRTDLEAGGHVDEALQAALEDSETLVVLCSPASAKSFWVNHEVETFLAKGREARIFPVIASGEPDSGNASTECFPPALRGRGLLAADLREIRLRGGRVIGDGRHVGKLKLLAGLLGVGLDALVQRERRRQRGLVVGFALVALVFAILSVAATGFAWFAIESRRGALAFQERILTTQSLALFEDRRRREAAAVALEAWGDETGHWWSPVLAYLAPKRDAAVAALQLALDSRIQPDADSVHPQCFAGIVAYSDDGDSILFSCHDYSVQRIDLAKGTKTTTFAGHTGKVLRMALSSDGRRLVTEGADETIRLWDASTAREIAQLAGGGGSLASLAFSPDGRAVVTAGHTGVRLWSSESGDLVRPILAADADGAVDVWAVGFSGDAARVLVLSGDQIRSWNVATGAALAGVPINPHGESGAWQTMRSASFSMDGTKIISAHDDDCARLWDVSTGKEIQRFGNNKPVDGLGHFRAVEHAFLSPDGRLVATTRGDATIHIWNAEGREVRRFGEGATPRSNGENYLSIAFSPDSKMLATIGDRASVLQWPTSGGALAAIDDSALVSLARAQITSCLTLDERIELGLPSVMPRWCSRFAAPASPATVAPS